MKKKELKAQISNLLTKLEVARVASGDLGFNLRDRDATIRRLTAEIEQMKANWRPVPITHEWTPRDPQCALCDEPRDSARHAS